MPFLHLEVCAGLCNRLRALISGICWAEDLGCDLVVHWPADHPACHAALSNLIEIRSLPPFVQIDPSYMPQARMILRTDEMTQEVSQWDKTEDSLRIRSYGRFHVKDNDRWLRHLRSIRMRAELEEMVKQILLAIPESQRIGVHIRRGDHEKSIRDSPFELFIEAMRDFPEDVRFIIATDDESVKQTLDTLFAGRCLFPARFRSRNTDKGMEQAILDLLALASCSQILGSAHSSFSEMAAAYGGSDLIVIKSS